MNRPRVSQVLQRWDVVLCVIVLLVFCAMAIMPCLFSAYDPAAVNMKLRLLPPSKLHWLGTDELGRDLWCRVVYGARASCIVLIGVLALAVPFGAFLGAMSGWFGGVLGTIITRFTDVWISLPKLVLAMVIPILIGKEAGAVVVIFSIALSLWPLYVQVAAVETSWCTQSMYLHIAHIQGAGFFYILRKHLLPMICPSLIVRLSLDGSSILLMAASLGFLGVGLSADVVEWGAMAAQGSAVLMNSPWVALVPGFAIGLVSFALNVLGDTVRDLLDPKQEV